MMMLPILAMFLIGAAQPPAGDFTYILVDGELGASAQPLAPIIDQVTGGMRSQADPARFAACNDRNFTGSSIRCIRALVPEGSAPPTIVFTIERRIISNVTGSRRFNRDTIRCVGARGSGRIGLPDAFTPTAAAQVAAGLPDCVRTALDDGRGWGRSETMGGVRTWSIPVEVDRLASDAAQARGWGPEQAIVEVLDAHTTTRNTGQCSLKARILYVESGYRFRAGDRVEIAAPCRWEGPDRISKMFAEGPYGSGQTARISVSYRDGVLQYVQLF